MSEPDARRDADVTLETPVEIGGCRLRNRLYRAPLLEHAGDDDPVDRLIEELEPCAEAGAGLIMQGATPIRGREGRAVPGMTGFDDPDRVASMRRLTDRINDHGGRIFAQLAHGGLRSMEIWHAGHRRRHPDLRQRVVSPPPAPLRLADRLGLLSIDADPLSTAEVYELAADFGRAADRAAAAGYDGIHLAGATMGIFQQFLSPFYNHRDDEFGGSLECRLRFFELVAEEIRERTDVPLVTKVPAETESPFFVRDSIDAEAAIKACDRLEQAGYDALVPVQSSPFWDHAIIRGEFGSRGFDDRFAEGFEAAFGGPWRRRLVELAARIDAAGNGFEAAWNADLCRRVRDVVDVPVLCVGGIRGRAEADRLLGEVCSMVGMARPFYAEPRLPARLLSTPGATVVCENCNNCVPPQAAGEPGVCRTPDVLARRGELAKQGAYDRPEGDGQRGTDGSGDSTEKIGDSSGNTAAGSGDTGDGTGSVDGDTDGTSGGDGRADV
ncbi:MAG: 2,4-dienoyl-CoA reductase-like NADH-dependent reductase (Old Yellow Enzyme family) [Natronomonas sp.]|uniref:oxidoreductase n=1 Tax=Natronomonas sp. TaxID=2184060 RepID=UPI0039897411